jgi:hypothetical protein
MEHNRGYGITISVDQPWAVFTRSAEMTFYLEGRMSLDGAHFKVSQAFATIQAALDAARIKMHCEAAAVWITDHQQRLILSAQEVAAMLADLGDAGQAISPVRTAGAALA